MSSLWSRVSGHSNSRVFIFISSQVAMKMVGHWSGDHRTLSLLLCLLSMVSGQVAEVSSDTSGYVDTVADGGYYSGNGYVYSGYQSEPGVQTSADTDRTLEIFEGVFTPVMVVATFVSALIGALVAPIINAGMQAFNDFVDRFEFSMPVIRRRKDDPYNRYQDRNMKSSPSFWELAMETMIEALEHNNNQ